MRCHSCRTTPLTQAATLICAACDRVARLDGWFEPPLGALVTMRDGGRMTTGIVREVLTAGSLLGEGIHRLRRRARVSFVDAAGHAWETHRDLIDLTIAEPAAQRSLF